jgi:hypothetical protein
LIALGVSGYAFHAAQSISPSLLRAGLRFSGRTPQTADRKAFQEITNLRNVGLTVEQLTTAKLCKTKLSEEFKIDPDRDCKALGFLESFWNQSD